MTTTKTDDHAMSTTFEPPHRRTRPASVARASGVGTGRRALSSVVATIGLAAIGGLAPGSAAEAGAGVAADRPVGARHPVDLPPPRAGATIGWVGSRAVDTVSDPIVAVVLVVALVVTVARFVLKYKWRQLDRDDGDLTESHRWSIRRRATDDHPSY